MQYRTDKGYQSDFQNENLISEKKDCLKLDSPSLLSETGRKKAFHLFQQSFTVIGYGFQNLFRILHGRLGKRRIMYPPGEALGFRAEHPVQQLQRFFRLSFRPL
jgi:hypothetical protein